MRGVKAPLGAAFVFALAAGCGGSDSQDSSGSAAADADDAAVEPVTVPALSIEEFVVEAEPFCAAFAEEIRADEAAGMATWEMGAAYEHAASGMSGMQVDDGTAAIALVGAMAELGAALPALDAAIEVAVDAEYGDEGAIVMFTENGEAFAHPPGTDWMFSSRTLEMPTELPLQVFAAEDARQAAATELGLADCAVTAYAE
jgi:hypothetical protein